MTITGSQYGQLEQLRRMSFRFVEMYQFGNNWFITGVACEAHSFRAREKHYIRRIDQLLTSGEESLPKVGNPAPQGASGSTTKD